MKILGGVFGGRIIKTSSKLGYRPTLSRVRKSIFDSLQPFHYPDVLDLFAGSGIFGFECASRGARSITFVDNDVKTFRHLKSNSEILSGPEYLFHKTDAHLFLKKAMKYDLIFADPPYFEYDLMLLAKKSLEHLNKHGKFILECNKSQEAILGAAKKNFGDTSVLFWTKS